MELSSEDINRIFIAAATGSKNPLDGEESEKLFNQIRQEILYLQQPMMAQPVNEWADDTYDELLEATEKAWGEYGNRIWDRSKEGATNPDSDETENG